MKIARYLSKSEVQLVFYSIQLVRQCRFLSAVLESKKSSTPIHFAASDWKKCTLKRFVIQNWEEIDSLKNEKVLE